MFIVNVRFHLHLHNNLPEDASALIAQQWISVTFCDVKRFISIQCCIRSPILSLVQWFSTAGLRPKIGSRVMRPSHTFCFIYLFAEKVHGNNFKIVLFIVVLTFQAQLMPI